MWIVSESYAHYVVLLLMRQGDWLLYYVVVKTAGCRVDVDFAGFNEL